MCPSKAPTPPRSLDEIAAPEAETPQELTELQQRWIERMLVNPSDPLEAAREAGYASESASSQVYALTRNERVMGELRRRATELLANAKVVAIATLIDLASNAKSENVKRQAAIDILNRTGHAVPRVNDGQRSNQKLEVNFDLSGGDGPGDRASITIDGDGVQKEDRP